MVDLPTVDHLTEDPQVDLDPLAEDLPVAELLAADLLVLDLRAVGPPALDLLVLDLRAAGPLALDLAAELLALDLRAAGPAVLDLAADLLAVEHLDHPMADLDHPMADLDLPRADLQLPLPLRSTLELVQQLSATSDFRWLLLCLLDFCMPKEFTHRPQILRASSIDGSGHIASRLMM